MKCICEQCGMEFMVANRRPHRFCSLTCAYASPNRIPKTPLRMERACVVCGATFIITERAGRGKKCCSPGCSKAAHADSVAKAVAAMKLLPHPRGALGMKHTEETRQRISARLRGRPANAPESYKAAVVTKLARYGTAGPRLTAGQAYSRVRSGKRADLEDRFFRSSWEANYARYLNWLVRKKQLLRWEYEPKTFRFEGVTRGPYTYTPDFCLYTVDGGVVYHEVKGWMDGPSKSRIARFRKFFPDINLVIIDSEVYRDINARGRWYSTFWE